MTKWKSNFSLYFESSAITSHLKKCLPNPHFKFTKLVV